MDKRVIMMFETREEALKFIELLLNKTSMLLPDIIGPNKTVAMSIGGNRIELEKPMHIISFNNNF